MLQHRTTGLHTPQLTHEHPQALAAHRPKPTPHDACIQPARNSRSRHPCARPGPVAAAHTPRVHANWHDEVPSSRRSAQRSQPQPTHAVYDTTYAEQDCNQRPCYAWAIPYSHRNIPQQSYRQRNSLQHTANSLRTTETSTSARRTPGKAHAIPSVRSTSQLLTLTTSTPAPRSSSSRTHSRCPSSLAR